VLAGEHRLDFRVHVASDIECRHQSFGIGTMPAHQSNQPRARDFRERPCVETRDHPTTDDGKSEHSVITPIFYDAATLTPAAAVDRPCSPSKSGPRSNRATSAWPWSTRSFARGNCKLSAAFRERG